MTGRSPRAAAAAIALSVLAAAPSDAFLIAPPGSPGPLPMTVVAQGLDRPVDIVHAGDGSGRLFVVEQPGRIRFVRGGAPSAQPFLDIQTLVLSGDERGLLGLAFHPAFAANGRFYVNYTRQPDGATVVARYRVTDGAPDLADPASGEVLLTIAQPYPNHNGGTLRFGPDGLLYIGTGDGGSGNDPGDRAQDPQSLLGKMLRIDVDGGAPYAIPPGNPHASGQGGRPEIWASGLRNPWKFSFDGPTLLIGDVGQDQREEIDAIDATTGAGANFGWRVLEGTRCTGLTGGAPCGTPGFVAPIVEYDHATGCSVTGGEVYRGAGNTVAALVPGTYVFGDFCTGAVYALARTAEPAPADLVELGRTGFNVSAFGRDATGEILVADFGGGRVLRIGAPAPAGVVPVVEFRNVAIDHYFITADAAEIAVLDTGVIAGWRRTGAAFSARSNAAAGTSPVCRYFLAPVPGGSHFHSADPAECDRVRAAFPAFVLETPSAMHVWLPDTLTGACPSPATQDPVYRVWNRRADTNHRYTRDPAIREAMRAAGGVPEGYGPDGVAWCAQR